MRYVDGYVLPVAKKHLGLYFSVARKAGKVWRDHGALEYRECVGEDLKVKWGALFPRSSGPSPARRWCSRGSCSSPGPTAIESTPRS